MPSQYSVEEGDEVPDLVLPERFVKRPGSGVEEADLATQLNKHFCELRASLTEHFAEQASRMEEVAREQQRMITQCLQHLGANRESERLRVRFANDLVEEPCGPPTPRRSDRTDSTLGRSEMPPSLLRGGGSSSDLGFGSTIAAERTGGPQLRRGGSSSEVSYRRGSSLQDVSQHQGGGLSMSAERSTTSEASRIALPFRGSMTNFHQERSRVIRQIMTASTDEFDDGGKVRNQSSGSVAAEYQSMASFMERKRVDGGVLARCVQHQLFDQLVGLLIVSNAVVIGLEADWQAANPGAPVQPWFVIADVCFAALFALELILKLLVFKSAFLCSPEWRWNLFDTFVVLSGVLELLVNSIDQISLAADVTYLRIMRIMKLVRVVRIVRVVLVFRELRIMLFSVMATMRSLIWTLISLFGLTFMAGVYITSSVAAHQETNFDTSLAKYFGSLPRTLLSLFQATSGGVDWRDLTDELEKVSTISVAIFLVYVCLVIYAVMNILTGVCVNQATRAADDDIEFVIQDELCRRNGATNTLRRFFHDADTEDTGVITWPQLREYLRNSQVRAYFKALGIEVWDLRTFFDLLRVPGQETASIAIDQFVSGCLRLKGSAKSSDLMAVRLEMDSLTRMCYSIQAAICRETRELTHEIRMSTVSDRTPSSPLQPERPEPPSSPRGDEGGEAPPEGEGNKAVEKL